MTLQYLLHLIVITVIVIIVITIIVITIKQEQKADKSNQKHKLTIQSPTQQAQASGQ